ncbi:hypothetical protein [Demequina capsici]|uniref:Uncharacterized protein n=1 Tax=Demequina capsici TaxID=3075620 RepID=A0AA96F8J8_9MICO|nr:hypothetical protein [Demequina sp. OYTSA14]WNM24752.1 hypothetical protein RN606_00960 [Demequina sp. OYTSA14]
MTQPLHSATFTIGGVHPLPLALAVGLALALAGAAWLLLRDRGAKARVQQDQPSAPTSGVVFEPEVEWTPEDSESLRQAFEGRSASAQHGGEPDRNPGAGSAAVSEREAFADREA